MGPPGGVVDPLTGLRIDDDEDDDDAAKGRRAAKAEKPRRRKGKPSDAADAGGGHAGKPDASKPRPRSRQKRGGASSDDDEFRSGDAEEEGKRRGGKGKARDKHHNSHAPRPGQIGFEGLDDGGRSQSLYKGMSRGAVKKALERDAAEKTRASAPPPLEAPEVTTPIFDACAHLARLAETARESNLSNAWAAGDLAALACAPVGAVVNVTCDVEALDPAYGASAYRAWDRLLGDEGEDDDIKGTRRRHATKPPRREDVYHAFGVHPSRAAEIDATALVKRVARFVWETNAVAVGVVGCDFRSADEDQRSAQLEVLAGCMAVARGEVEKAGTDDASYAERGSAFSSSNENENAEKEEKKTNGNGRVSTRAPESLAPATPATPLVLLLASLGGDDADDAVFLAFAKHRETCVAAGASRVPAVFLDPSPRLASAALATFPDALVSVSGAVTHAKNVSLLEVAFDTPLDRIALASEAPGKMPTQLVGRHRRGGGGGGAHAREWSHPASLAFAAEKVAEVKGRGITAEEVVAAAARNARHAFLGTPE
jgi:Tat protein secretion system quality control protein TatD with DNase activity